MLIVSLMIMMMMMVMIDNGDKDKFMIMMSAVPKGRSEGINPPSRE